VRAVDGGFITPDRAKALFEFLQRDTAVSNVYPNNALARVLAGLCTEGGWSAQAEGELLHCLYSLYVGYETGGAAQRRIGISISYDVDDAAVTTSEIASSTFRPPADIAFYLGEQRTRESPRLRSLYDLIFDDAPVDMQLTERLVAFTGPFKLGTRADCFVALRHSGGVPCEPAPYLDYLFVSREHEAQRVISRQIESAIYFRRLQGTPKIYREADWESVLICAES
jgi:hypothetical protein